MNKWCERGCSSPPGFRCFFLCRIPYIA